MGEGMRQLWCHRVRELVEGRCNEVNGKSESKVR